MPEPATLAFTAVKALVVVIKHVRAAKEVARLNYAEMEDLSERIRDNTLFIKAAVMQGLRSEDAALDAAISNIKQHDLADLRGCISLDTWRLVMDIPVATAAATAAFQLEPQVQGVLAELQRAAGGHFSYNHQVVMWMAMLTVGTAGQQYQALCEINDYLAASASKCEDIAASGIVPMLLDLLGTSSVPSIQVIDTMLLGNLCLVVNAGAYFVEAGGVPVLVQLMESSNAGLQDLAARAVSNLANGADYSDVMISAGTIPALVRLLKSTEEAVQEWAARRAGFHQLWSSAGIALLTHF